MQSKLTIGAGLAALAAALALTAAPASARDRHENNGWQQREAAAEQNATREAARPDRSAQPERNWSRQEQRTDAPQARPQQPTSTPQVRQQQWAGQQQRNWGDGRQQQRDWTEGRQQQRNWGEGRQQRSYTPPAQNPQGSQWGQNAQRTERNGGYADRDRNTTYQNGYRNDGYRGSDNQAYRNNGYRGGNNQAYRNGYNNNNRQWDRSWRNNNNYDWQRYRSSNRNVYHVGRYYAPYQGYSYRRLGVGFYLDSLFFGQNYWIGDPGYYRLPDVYGPYRWVRYYDDAVLVDIYSGEVVDVIYDFFW